MIEINNLSFSYGSSPFIDSVNLRFFDGSLTAIIGENGSGKSTLLKLISGELCAKEGAVILNGKNQKSLSQRETAKILSYFPQGRTVPDMTALEIVSLGRFACGFKDKKAEKEISLSALEYVGASKFADISLKNMSYGERQKVYLAMQIAQNAQNCLLDEPTNYLDISAKFSTMDTLTKLRDEGKCVVCVLHDLSLAMRCADRIIVMKSGKIFADGTPTELYENERIAHAFNISLERVTSNGEISYVANPKQI